MQTMTRSIKACSLGQLEQLMAEFGQPKFRAAQLAQWLYVHHVNSYDQMTNLSLSLRSKLTEAYPLSVPSIVDKQVSHDGTRKYVLECEDGKRVETVAMPSGSQAPDDVRERLTVCFSTQVGCAMQCAFCETGHEGFSRNLSVGEMVDQILIAQEDMGQRVSNVVAMGQGEPFLNYDNTLAALRILNHAKLLKIGARRITVSTCGIIPGINRFANEPEQFTLAVSLHAARQSVRDVLMPQMTNQPLSRLRKALQQYLEKTDRRITLEYLLIDGINDNEEDLAALIDFCSGLLVHINLLPMNAVASSCLQPSPPSTVFQWREELERKHIETTLRKSRGADIAGACGQLKNAVAR